MLFLVVHSSAFLWWCASIAWKSVLRLRNFSLGSSTGQTSRQVSREKAAKKSNTCNTSNYDTMPVPVSDLWFPASIFSNSFTPTVSSLLWDVFVRLELALRRIFKFIYLNSHKRYNNKKLRFWKLWLINMTLLCFPSIFFTVFIFFPNANSGTEFILMMGGM